MTNQEANEILYDYSFGEFLNVANAIATLLDEQGNKVTLIEAFSLAEKVMQTDSLRRIASYLEPDR